MDQAKLDDYLRQAQAFISAGWLDSQELNYKRKAADALADARPAVHSGDSEWPLLVKKGFIANLAYWHSRALLLRWFETHVDEALRAMQVLWADDATPPDKRLRESLSFVPRHLVDRKGRKYTFGGVNQRLRAFSALLIGLGPERYPPFKVTEFNEAYDHLGYPRSPSGADEGATYVHAREFLDRIVERARELGFERPRDRLEAQSIVYRRKDILSPVPHVTSLEGLAEKLLIEVKYLQNIERLLEDKKQVIFQGPPGTGKTFVAQELATYLAGSEERVRLVQFHPSYAYEDFVQGFRPKKDKETKQLGFSLTDGPLVDLAEQASEESDQKHILVIDEINRGNLSKVFGELYFLLEYRNKKMRLQYSGAEETDTDADASDVPNDSDAGMFSLPSNLYIIGTMNTADRSIALVDLALRRRFHFVEFHPGKDPIKGLLGRWLERKAKEKEWSDKMEWLPDVVDAANKKLGNEEAAIGPSYFMKDDINDSEKLNLVWDHNVIPYIEEQLYGSTLKIEDFALKTLKDEVAAASSPPDGEPGGSDESAPGGNEGN